jgi:ADP-heptose:LPS heptosyltransferase
MKSRLLVFELWGMGDLVLTTPFLRAAARQFDLYLLAKPIARDLQPLLWPDVNVIPFTFPWTAFRGKYNLIRWPWRDLSALTKRLRSDRFNLAVSARWDPRDHFLLSLTGASERIGFPRLCSGMFLTERLTLPTPGSHHYENWRVLGHRLGIDLPPIEQLDVPVRNSNTVVIHTGAAQLPRVWPLDRFQALAAHLRESRYNVQIACDPAQREWWISRGENVRVPASLPELVALIDSAGIFVGNDSGPGHLAAIRGVPTFTLFGNQFPNRFAPLHPSAEWVEGSHCPYKPCYDSCRFAAPQCLWSITTADAWLKLKVFAEKCLDKNTEQKTATR